MYHKA